MPQSSTKAELSAAELDLKRRGRRRLIGAVTIGLLAVVILPMVFDHEPKSNTAQPATAKQEIEIRIPPKDAAAPLPPPTLPPAESAKPVTAEQTPPAAQPALTAPTAPKAEVAPPIAKLESKALPNPEPAKTAPAKATPPEKSTAPAPSSATAPTTTQSNQANKPNSNGAGKFVVQIGAYKDAANAKTVIAQMKEAKLPVFSDTVAVQSGNVTRVRLGPFPTKEKAERALVQAKLSGITGKVVPLQ
jgi:DedD protein